MGPTHGAAGRAIRERLTMTQRAPAAGALYSLRANQLPRHQARGKLSGPSGRGRRWRLFFNNIFLMEATGKISHFQPAKENIGTPRAPRWILGSLGAVCINRCVQCAVCI